jgi:uncharacterized protein YndB with AHSA1/START domain
MQHIHSEITRSARYRHLAIGTALGLVLVCAGGARAEIVGAGANGFEVKETAHIAAPPDKVYAALITPSRWWSSDHTFSQDAANLKLDAHAGGCWCEALPDGGSVEHMQVVFASPGKALRLRGALGPFQAMGAEGAMAWTFTPGASGGTDVVATLSFGGYTPEGLDKHAAAVDGVFGDQVQRLKRLIETGAPQ